MGLTNWPNANIRKQDVTVSKNYLVDAEIRELNRLTNILPDIFEDQLDLGRLIVMEDVERLLDQQLKALNRAVLAHGGRVRTSVAKARAEQEFEAFDARRRGERREKADAVIAELKETEKALSRRKRPKP